MGFKGTDRCLAKVKPDEPIFVLRAQDVLAPSLVRQWAWTLHERVCGANPGHFAYVCPLPKAVEARALADQMDAWPLRKVPD